MKKICILILSRFAYPILLTVVSAYVLVIFIRPVANVRAGINFYYRSRFLDMVNGTAYKPFVYRTLLPTTVRLISRGTPSQYRQAFDDLAEKLYGSVFTNFGWEVSAAYEYTLAFSLMFMSFMGFGHYSAKLVMLTCKMTETQITRGVLVTSILLCLPPFFRYTSFPYDPPQLFFFTIALYFLATSRHRGFLFTFILCCINKETAVLLIPVYAIAGYKQRSSARNYWTLLLGLLISYMGIRSAITFAFRSNPGSFVEFQLDHNVDLFTQGWAFTDIVVLLIFLLLLFHKWNEKAEFLKVSFLCILPPLMTLAVFLGFIDEWRGYYEAYPIAFGLIVDSILRLRSTLYQNHDNITSGDRSDLQQLHL